MGKHAVLLLLTILAALNLLMVGSVFAQSIPEPSVPEFTAQLADHSYGVPPTTTTTTNPYNNETITNTQPGYYVKNITIDLTIENQPYPAIINGNESFVYFMCALKVTLDKNGLNSIPITAIHQFSPVQTSQ